MGHSKQHKRTKSLSRPFIAMMMTIILKEEMLNLALVVFGMCICCCISSTFWVAHRKGVVFGIHVLGVVSGAHSGLLKRGFVFSASCILAFVFLLLYLKLIVVCTKQVLYLAFVFGAVSRAHCGLRTREEAL